MNTLLLTVLCACLYTAYSSPVEQSVLGFSLGDCKRTNVRDRVWFEPIDIPGEPGVVRSHLTRWDGNIPIHCAIVVNQHKSWRLNTTIVEGGMQQDRIALLLNAPRGYGIKAEVSVYASQPKV